MNNLSINNLVCVIAMILASALLIIAVVVPLFIHRKRRKTYIEDKELKNYLFQPFQIFIIGFFLYNYSLFFVANYVGVRAGMLGESIFYSFLNAVHVFLFGGNYTAIVDSLNNPEILSSEIFAVLKCYILGAFILSPLMTAGFVLSFFKNAISKMQFVFKTSKLNFFGRTKHLYYISDLNERSLALATNILTEEKEKNPLVIFFDVTEKDEKSEIVDHAKRLGAILFKKDIVEANFRRHQKNLKRDFYFIGPEEEHNVQQALTLINDFVEDKLLNTENNNFYIFAISDAAGIILDTAEKGNLNVRRINGRRNLVYKTLLQYPVFNYAKEEDGVKKIKVLIAGLGEYGMEFLKAIVWITRVIGYETEIDVIDISKDIIEKAKAQVPEFFCNQESAKGYNITFHPKINVYDVTLRQELETIGEKTIAFVGIKTDSANIEASMNLSCEYARLSKYKNWTCPRIFTVVYDSEKFGVLTKKNFVDYKGNDFGITFIGDRLSRYSLDAIKIEKIDAIANKLHMYWAEKDIRDAAEVTDELIKKREEAIANYKKYEYYRNSCVAQAIHIILCQKIGVVNRTNKADEAIKDDTLKKKIMKMEHDRWNAYMRSEGFVYNNERYELAKMHNNLIAFNDLSDSERALDQIRDVSQEVLAYFEYEAKKEAEKEAKAKKQKTA